MTSSADHDTVAAVVLAAIAKRLAGGPGGQGSEIDLDTPILSLDGMESIQVLRAVAEIEDVCEVFIPDDALADAITVRDLVTLITKLQSDGRPW